MLSGPFGCMHLIADSWRPLWSFGRMQHWMWHETAPPGRRCFAAHWKLQVMVLSPAGPCLQHLPPYLFLLASRGYTSTPSAAGQSSPACPCSPGRALLDEPSLAGALSSFAPLTVQPHEESPDRLMNRPFQPHFVHLTYPTISAYFPRLITVIDLVTSLIRFPKNMSSSAVSTVTVSASSRPNRSCHQRLALVRANP